MADKKKKKGAIIGVTIGVVVIVVLVGIFFLVRRGSNAGASTYVTAQVQTGSIEKTISGSGQLQAASTSEVAAKVSGTVTGLAVKLGSSVTTGTVLFTVDDNGTLAAAVTSASNSLQSAQLSLTAARQSLASAQAASVTTAQELLNASKASSSGSGSNTSTNSENSSSVLGENTGSKGLTGANTSTNTNTNTSASSSNSSSTLTLAQAQAQAKQANAQRAAQIASAQAQVKQAQAQVTSAQSDYDTAVKNQGETTVTSPSTGVVTALNVANGDSVTGASSTSSNNNSSNNSGLGSSNNYSNNNSSNANSSSSSSAVEISDYSSAMTADISVSESDISSIQNGQNVRLSFSAFSSLDATGVVTQISPTGTSSGSLVDFTVTMTLKDPDKQLRPGMSVTAEIVTASAENVLMVPNTAIDEGSDGTYTVRVAQNGNTADLQTVTVTVGIANDSYTEVKSGLTAGQVVVSGTTTSSSNSSTSSNSLLGGMGGGAMRVNGAGTYRSTDGGGNFQGNPGGGF